MQMAAGCPSSESDFTDHVAAADTRSFFCEDLREVGIQRVNRFIYPRHLMLDDDQVAVVVVPVGVMVVGIRPSDHDDTISGC